MTDKKEKLSILIAGATGAIGKPIVTKLLSEGHTVFGMTRSEKSALELKALGAIPVSADALDQASVQSAMESSNPDVVIEMLTSLPKEYTPKEMEKAAAYNTRLKLEGGANLQSAAESVGVKRYLLQSTAFWYAPGEGLATEKTPLATDPSLAIAGATQVYAAQEKRVLTSKNIEGVSLRFGFFYGPGTWFEKGQSMARQVLSGTYPIVGKGTGVWSFVHVEDAAKAVSAALFSEPGIYNLTNDTPLPLSVWLPSYAKWLEAPPPPVKTVEEELQTNGAMSVYYATKLRGASNKKAKEQLGFHPRKLEWIS